MTDFFISYTQADREWARWIRAVLIKAGYSVRLQHDDFPPGSNFPVEMHKALIECSRTIAVLSPDYQRSRFGMTEWAAIFAQDPIGEARRLFPVRVREMKPEGLLASIVYIDLVGLGEAAALGELLIGLRKGAASKEDLVFPGDSSPPFPGPPASPPGVDEALTRVHGLPIDKVPAPAPLPAGSRMPHPVNPMFVGRDEELRELVTALKVGESVAIGQVAAATGMGGIGKTQLASEFVHRYGHFFEGGVFWMSFADPAGVPAEVAACGRLLKLHPQFSELPLEQQAQLVRDSWQENPLPRLLVFDNCEEPELLREWRPTTGRARVLLTSRRARWDPAFGIHSQALEILSRPASIELLRRLHQDIAEKDLVLGEIAQELGDLPLALHLAGNFLRRYRHTTFGQPKAYLEGLRRGDLLDHPSLQGERVDFIPTSHDAHVARTFALSYTRLDSENHVDALAQRLLARASYLAPGEPIPRSLLMATLGISEEASEVIAAEEALGKLIDLGLLEQGEDGYVAMHRLVAHFAKPEEQASQDQRAVEEGLRREMRRLNQTGFSRDLLNWQPHLRFVVEAASLHEDKVATDLSNELGLHLLSIGDYSGSRRYLEQALAIQEKILNPEHPDTATSLNNLGGLLEAQGDLYGARPNYERALAIREKVLGPEHPDTATSLNNLGALLQNLGDFPGARSNYERALSIREKVLNPEHSDTAMSLNNLGSLLKDLGDLAGARSNYERALAIWEKALGPEHPDTALSLSNLGALLADLGDLAGARSNYERALVIREKIQGPEHPDTALSLNNLGSVLNDLGDLSGARSHYERALAITEKVLGPVHPDTAFSLNNLGALLYKLSDIRGARLYLERALAIREKVLGPVHPDTAFSLNNLGTLLYKLGDFPGARLYLERALAIREKVLGPEHPYTKNTRRNLEIVLPELFGVADPASTESAAEP